MRIVMMGTGTFAEPTFEALLKANERVVGLVTQPERSTGRKGGSTRQTGVGMAAIALAHNVPVIQPESINTPDGVALLRALEPDLLVVAAYGQILSNEVIGTPKLGAINVHASLLPKYRGASPIAHAILTGETVTGVTIIRITLGLDAGEMLDRAELEILPDETTGELEARIAPIGAGLALNVIQRMKRGPLEGIQQDPMNVTKAPKIKKEHGLIDWSKSAEQIVRQVRAFQPWPTAYAFFHRPGKEPLRVIVYRAEAGELDVNKSPVDLGAIVVGKEPPIVAMAASGKLLIRELQPAGKKRMTAEEFLRGHPLQAGYRFGPEKLS